MRKDPARAREFTRMLFEVHQAFAKTISELLGTLLDMSGVHQMMDIGGGSGVVSMALLRKYPALRATVVDIENVCIAGREIAAEQGLADRISYHPAEFAHDEFPTGFDLIIKCDVSVYGVWLYKKLWQVLVPGGRLVFVEHISPTENSAPPTRVGWTFLNSLEDPNYHTPTLAQVQSMLVADPRCHGNTFGVTFLEDPDTGAPLIRSRLDLLEKLHSQGRICDPENVLLRSDNGRDVCRHPRLQLQLRVLP